MKLSHFLSLVAAVLALPACSPKLTSSITRQLAPLTAEDDIVVIDARTAIPDNAILLGTAKVGDSGFTTPANGTYDKTLSLVMGEARSAGGNVIRITKEIPPTPNYTTHRIEAEIYRLDDLSLLTREKENDTVVTSQHPDYAIIYFYRPGDTIGPLVKYDVYINDTKVYHCVRNTKAEVKIYEPAKVRIWAKTEAKTEITLDVAQGEDYYIECDVAMGIFVGRPDLRVTDPRFGVNIYNSIDTK